MNAIEVIQNTYMTSQFVLKKFLEDMNDTDLMHRPGPGCNHLAWQLGHLIASECQLLEMIAPGSAPKLPDGFAEKHNKEHNNVDDPGQFYTKQEYIDLFGALEKSTSVALSKVTETDLDQPGPEKFRSVFPKVGNLWILIATHALMHVGQFVPVRRKTGKPVVI